MSGAAVEACSWRFHARAVGVFGGDVHVAVGAVFVADAVQSHGEVVQRRQVDAAAVYVGADGQREVMDVCRSVTLVLCYA